MRITSPSRNQISSTGVGRLPYTAPCRSNMVEISRQSPARRMMTTRLKLPSGRCPPADVIAPSTDVVREVVGLNRRHLNGWLIVQIHVRRIQHIAGLCNRQTDSMYFTEHPERDGSIRQDLKAAFEAASLQISMNVRISHHFTTGCQTIGNLFLTASDRQAGRRLSLKWASSPPWAYGPNSSGLTSVHRCSAPNPLAQSTPTGMACMLRDMDPHHIAARNYQLAMPSGFQRDYHKSPERVLGFLTTAVMQ